MGCFFLRNFKSHRRSGKLAHPKKTKKKESMQNITCRRFHAFAPHWQPRFPDGIVIFPCQTLPRVENMEREANGEKHEDLLNAIRGQVGFKCATFGASRIEDRHLATGTQPPALTAFSASQYLYRDRIDPCRARDP